MDAEREKRRDALLEEALGLDSGRRAVLLDALCGPDATLRRELEQLLTLDRRIGPAFLEGGAAAAAGHPLTRGQTLGRYVIEEVIGSGGMSVVYHATDPGIARPVAIKVLLPTAHDADRTRRFFEELRTLGTLRNDHVVRVYDFGEVNGLLYLVMELLEGETLAQAIAAGRVGDLGRRLEIARQLAVALRDLHAAGIVHRDVKPANVFVETSGRVKLMDFGIACADGPHRTHASLLCGTPEYLAPEQIQGERASPLSDVYAYGVLLIELFTGQRPYRGTLAEILYRIVHEPLDLSSLPAELPAPIADVIAHATAKNPNDRTQGFDELLRALDGTTSASGAHASNGAAPTRSGRLAAAVAPKPSRGARRLLASVGIAIVFIVALAGGVAFLRLNRSQRPSGPVTRLLLFPPRGSSFLGGFALSPDERQIAADTMSGSARLQIWMRSLDGLDFRPVPGTENGAAPFWSPDGRWLGFYNLVPSELRKISTSGGIPVTICPVPPTASKAEWNRDGTIVFSADNSFFRVSSEGGRPTAITMKYTNDDAYRAFSSMLPDGDHFLFYSARNDSQSTNLTLNVGSIRSGISAPIFTSDYPALFAADHVVFVKGNQVLAQQFDPLKREVRGFPTAVTEITQTSLYPASGWGIAATPNVLIVQNDVESSSDLTWFDRNGRPLDSLARPPSGEYLWPSLSPNGSTVAVHRREPQSEAWNIWLLKGRGDAPSRLTFGQTRNIDAVWSPDGREIAYASLRGGRFAIYKTNLDRTDVEHLLYQGTERELATRDWSSDGRFLLYEEGVGTDIVVWALPLPPGNGPPRRLTQPGETAAYGSRFSPDGRWVAYASIDAGRFDLFVRAFPSGPKYQITTTGALHPRWRRDGRELFYVTNDGAVMALNIALSRTAVQAGTPRPLHVETSMLFDSRPHYAVSSDGQRFLVRRATGPQNALTVIQNWSSLLKK